MTRKELDDAISLFFYDLERQIRDQETRIDLLIKENKRLKAEKRQKKR